MTIEAISFHPAPLGRKSLSAPEYGEWIDHYFGPIDEMEVSVKVKNSGADTVEESAVSITLYADDSGGLPTPEARLKVAEQESKLAGLGPGRSSSMRFQFLDLSPYHQKFRLLYLIEVNTPTAPGRTHEVKKYFLLLRGE